MRKWKKCDICGAEFKKVDGYAADLCPLCLTNYEEALVKTIEGMTLEQWEDLDPVLKYWEAYYFKMVAETIEEKTKEEILTKALKGV